MELILVGSNKDIPPVLYMALLQPQIATYDLDYGKGKVIVIGLYRTDLLKKQKFIEFFDGIMLQK
jgi:hypothetical protein